MDAMAIGREAAMFCDRIWTHANLATVRPDRPGIGEVPDGIVACRDTRIVYAGARADAPADLEAAERVDCGGRWITPGLIDCHTHLVYAGDRSSEFELRLQGTSYDQIAKAGGGIVSTMKATRAASEQALVGSALRRLDALIAEGVTTIEVKSGYGLNLDAEQKQLRAARALAERRPVTIVPTLLGAHALPPEAASADAYIDQVCSQMIPAVAQEGLAESVDAFCERVGFSREQTVRVFEAATAHGLRVKLHADQLSNGHGAALAAQFQALSADHLEFTDEEGVRAMASAGVVAVLLPGAYYFLRETQKPPVDSLRRHRVPMALATDCNPGTSPLTSLLLAMNMGATLFGLTVDECIAGVTRAAASALGRLSDLGTLEAGKSCDLAIWDIGRPAELVYHMGFNPLFARVWRGQ
jgi:imidazolonepropionase